MSAETPRPVPVTLTGKVVLVTGAARRVGAQIARVMHAAGANLLLHYHSSAEDAAALAGEFNALRPDSAQATGADLLDVAQLPELVSKAVHAFGGLDILINNASTFYPTPSGASPRSTGTICSAPTSRRRCSSRRRRTRRCANAPD